mgnify:CR=1 FL=1
MSGLTREEVSSELDQASSLESEPQVSTAELLEFGSKHLLGNYRQAPMVLVKGSGCFVEDSEQKRYLDFAAGVAVNALGHSHPKLVQAISEQAATLMHVSNYFFNQQNLMLAAELTAATGFSRAFFCNSGGEANEAMLKLARRYQHNRGKKEKLRFIAFENSFHGRTFATVNLTGTASYREGFGEFPGVTHVPYGDLDAVKRVLSDDVCGIFVEPVQGEGGVLPAPAGFLQGLRELCDEQQALLLVDEVQTGIGRTGTVLGLEHSGVRADVVTLAKGLGGGFPIGAMLVREELSNVLTPGTHGSTFGGNALASRAARVVLEVLLMVTLFASYVCSAMAMRYFSHAGFVMSMPVAAPERQALSPMAKEYVKRAGLLYSWALRFFLIIAPLVVGVVRPIGMPFMAVALVVALWFFDRPAKAAAGAA